VANGIKTIEGIELFKTGIHKAGNADEAQAFNAARLDRWIKNTNLKGFDTAISWIEHPSKDFDKYLYHTDRKTGRVAPLFGGFRNFRRVDGMLKADAVVRAEWADAMGTGNSFRKPSIVVTGEEDDEVITSVAMLVPEINPIVKDLAPLPSTQIKMSEFDKYFDPKEGGEIKRFTLTSDFSEDETQLQFSQEKTDMTDLGKELATKLKDVEKKLEASDKLALKFSQQLTDVDARLQISNELNEKLSKQLDESKARAELARSANITATNLQFSESLKTGRMAPNFVEKIGALTEAMSRGKTMLKFSEQDEEAPVLEKVKAIFSEMVKDPTGVFMPPDDTAKQKTPEHPHAAKGKDKDGNTAKFSEIADEIDSRDAACLDALKLSDDDHKELANRMKGGDE